MYILYVCIYLNMTNRMRNRTPALSFSQRKVPVYESMFSGLPHYPWYTLDVHTTDPVPAFVDRSWQGCKDERKEALHQLAG